MNQVIQKTYRQHWPEQSCKFSRNFSGGYGPVLNLTNFGDNCNSCPILALSFNCNKNVKNQIFYYYNCMTPKRITCLRGLYSRHCASKQHSSFWRNIAAMKSRWQNCVPFDRPEIWMSDLPLQKQTRYCSVHRPERNHNKLGRVQYSNKSSNKKVFEQESNCIRTRK